MMKIIITVYHLDFCCLSRIWCFPISIICEILKLYSQCLISLAFYYVLKYFLSYLFLMIITLYCYYYHSLVVIIYCFAYYFTFITYFTYLLQYLRFCLDSCVLLCFVNVRFFCVTLAAGQLLFRINKVLSFSYLILFKTIIDVIFSSV